MDEEDVYAICFLLTLLAFPFVVVLGTTGLVAYSRTKKWAAEKRAKLDPESSSSSSLLPTKDSSDDEESDYLDTEDEAEQTAAKVEAKADLHKTFAQMWRKEFKKVWSGKGVKRIAKEKEREERRKLAKAVARELDRRERRRARRAQREMLSGDSEADTLPKYEK